MKQTTCRICGKVIEGFTERDLEYKMIMHNLKHRDKTKTQLNQQEVKQCNQ